jgi:hypothetical protein
MIAVMRTPGALAWGVSIFENGPRIRVARSGVMSEPPPSMQVENAHGKALVQRSPSALSFSNRSARHFRLMSEVTRARIGCQGKSRFNSHFMDQRGNKCPTHGRSKRHVWPVRRRSARACLTPTLQEPRARRYFEKTILLARAWGRCYLWRRRSEARIRRV